MSSPLRILLVDDEERFRTTLGKRLIERELEIATAGSGLEAIEELKNNPYDVVILDIKMPGMDGIETLAEVRKIKPGVEVILLTGHGSIDSAVEGMRLGAYDYIMKPCEIEELVEKIYGAFEQKTARDERIRQAEIRSATDRGK